MELCLLCYITKRLQLFKVFLNLLPLQLNFFLEAEESAVEEHFLDCGTIVAVRIVRDQVTGVGRGFGYVLFEVWETNALSHPLKWARGDCHYCFIIPS